MKKTIIIVCVALFAVSCGGRNARIEWRTERDSVSYAIGLNVGENIFRLDSTLNAEIVAQAIRDVYRDNPRMTIEAARFAYLRYVNVSQPEAIRSYENQFLADFREANRTYSINESGLTYEVPELGDESRTPRNLRDSVALRYTIKSTTGTVIRNDSLRTTLAEISPKGLQQAVRLAGAGGVIGRQGGVRLL